MDSAKNCNFDSLMKIIALCDKMVSIIDVDSLAKHFGVRHKEDEGDSKLSKEMGNKKDILIDVLQRKLTALDELQSLTLSDQELLQSKDISSYEAALEDVQKWVDLEKQSKLRKAYLKTLTKTKKFGKALHHLLKAFYDNDLSTPSKDSYTELIELFDALDWKIWKNHFMAKMIQECPTL
jgi:hypothetical protein